MYFLFKMPLNFTLLNLHGFQGLQFQKNSKPYLVRVTGVWRFLKTTSQMHVARRIVWSMDEEATDEMSTDEDCHILPLTGLNAFVYTGLNDQKLRYRLDGV